MKIAPGNDSSAFHLMIEFSQYAINSRFKQKWIFFCLISEASWGLSKGGKCSICNWSLCFWILSTSTDFQLIYSRKIVQINLTRNFQILFAYSQFVFVMKKFHTLHECKVDIFGKFFTKYWDHFIYSIDWVEHFICKHSHLTTIQNFMNFDWKIQQFHSILWNAPKCHWIVFVLYVWKKNQTKRFMQNKGNLTK